MEQRIPRIDIEFTKPIHNFQPDDEPLFFPFYGSMSKQARIRTIHQKYDTRAILLSGGFND